MKKRTINFKAVMAAVAAGGGYELAIQGAAKKVDFVNQNYLVTKSLTAGIIGSGLLYFGKPGDETQKAAGYALLGVGGASGAGKISTLMVTSGDEPMNGRRAKMLRNVITRKRPQISQAKAAMFTRGGGALDAIRAPRGMRPNERTMQRPQPSNAGGGYWKQYIPAFQMMC
jgi:hypothetical protein